jgi:hypothetical protein
MRFLALAVAASGLLTSAYADPNSFTYSGAPCGSDAGTREHIARQEHEFQAFVQNQASAGNDTLTKRAANVAVYWNIIYDQNNANDGNYKYVPEILDGIAY